MLKFWVHYGLHFILPLVIALIIYRKHWLKAYLMMLSAFIIDFDHLIANPIFDPNRCSINFHPLHTYYAIVLYLVLLVPKQTRILGIGLLIHIIADSIDCLLI